MSACSHHEDKDKPFKTTTLKKIHSEITGEIIQMRVDLKEQGY